MVENSKSPRLEKPGGCEKDLSGYRPRRHAITVFNIKGNAYRLIVRMEYRKHLIFIVPFLTHAEYDKGAWKK